MRKSDIYSLVFFCLLNCLALAGCSEKEVMEYEGVDAIYFDVQYGASHGNENVWARQYYTHVSFGVIDETEVDVRMKVGIAGSVKDYDRPFRVEIVKDSTDAVPEEEYTGFVENHVIKAGENHTYVEVKIKKSERMMTDTAKIQFRLVPGEHFVLAFSDFGKIPGRWSDSQTDYSQNKDAAIHNVFADNRLQMPKGWGGTQYFGEFSSVKYQYLLDVSGYTKAHFEQLGPMTQGGRARKIASKARVDLLDHFDQGCSRLQDGDPDGWQEWILDEKGTMMWLPGIEAWNAKTTPEELVKQYYKPKK